MFGKLFQSNIGNLDRVMRLLGGVALFVIVQRSHFHSHIAINVMRGISGLAIVSALTGFSVIYRLFNISTSDMTNKPSKTKDEDDYWGEFVSSTPKVKSRTPLDFSFPEDKKPPPPKRVRVPPQRRYELEKDIPREKINELIGLLEKNQLDEVMLLRVYEKIFSCEVTIVPAHINTYQCNYGKDTQLLDYPTIRADLLRALKKT